METIHNRNTEPVSQEYWLNAIRPLFEGRKVILAGEVIAGLIPRARMMRELGAESTFMLATEGMGTGDPPTAEDGHWFAIDTPPEEDIVAAIHAGQKTLASLPKHAQEALDWFDPNRDALVVGGFLNEHRAIAGRATLAYRKPEWLALDDKTIIDSAWDKIGVAREKSEVVPVDKKAILQAMQRLNRGDGVVWASDSKDGINGGGVGVRWVRSESDIDSALEYFIKHCDKLRVMPFLEGIPCSIHGMVFPDYVAAFRPVEMVVLRQTDSSEFFYAGTANFYDPAPADRDYMRVIAKKVGSALRDMVDFRGVFTIDGVMTSEGFRPTELNPRYGAGVMPLLKGLNNLPLEIISQAVISGLNVDFKARELEELIIKVSDEQRGGGTWRAFKSELPHIDKRPVKLAEEGWQWTEDDAGSVGTVSVGPGPIGSFVRFTPTGPIPVGPPFATLARDFWRFIDENVGGNIGQLEAAKSVR